MSLHGRNFVGTETSSKGSETLQAFSPITNEVIADRFYIATGAEVDSAVTLAAAALKHKITAQRRAEFLNAIAENLLSAGDRIVELAHRETALPIQRLTAERLRTVNQLRMFADLVMEGSWVDARIDTADSNRQPLPKPDLRRMLTPIGPVAVFGASNFPFAYSVAGGDTSSALAAGCSVIVKAHPAHPGTSELTAEAVVEAARSTKMPDGIFSMLHGGAAIGQTLIKHPKLSAAGFTGSLAGGRALCDAAAARLVPIPVHAEMGSVNPVFLLPDALKRNVEKIAAGLAQSVTLGTGQFCVNPGIVVAIAGPDLTNFTRLLAAGISSAPTYPMLTQRIFESYVLGLQQMNSHGAAALVVPQDAATAGIGALFSVDAQTFLKTPQLAEEVFGPVTLIVTCKNANELEEVAESLSGQLTGSIHAEPRDLLNFSNVVDAMTARVGRVVYNGYPTNVEVNPSMQHGGPYPAASDSRYTSVGTAAIFRFARPVCWQNAPSEVLPLELQNSNPRNIRRLINGVGTSEPLA